MMVLVKKKREKRREEKREQEKREQRSEDPSRRVLGLRNRNCPYENENNRFGNKNVGTLS